MLGPMSDSLLVRLLYAIASFASRELLTRLDIEPTEWEILWLSIAFILVKTMTSLLLDDWKPTEDSPVEEMSKDIISTAVDANLYVFMFIIVQWGIDLFEEWWKHTDAIIVVSAVVVEVPVLLMQAIVMRVAVTKFSESSPNTEATITSARRIMTQLNFSISYFVADRAATQVDMTPEIWDFVWLVLGFTVWYVAYQKFIRNPWQEHAKSIDDEGERGLVEIFDQNITTINTAMVLVVTNMFVNIVQIWWNEGEHWIVAVMLFSSVLFIALFSVSYFSVFLSSDDSAPDYMVNRSLFSMAMFIAKKGTSSTDDIEKTVWKVTWSIIAFLALHYSIQAVLLEWNTNFVKTKGDRVLHDTVQKFMRTWITIATTFVVNWLVGIFAQQWEVEGDWVVSVCGVQMCLTLLITAVKSMQFFEGVYGNSNADLGLGKDA